MARFDPALLVEPVSDETPCGPDLDSAFDADYLTFFSSSVSLLPNAFFVRREDGSGSDDFVLKASDKDVDAAFEMIRQLSDRTRDLRLAVRHGKLVALCREADEFAKTLEGVAKALEDRWEPIHPQGEDGDYFVRMQTVQALDENTHVILPLQHAPLLDLGRAGRLSYRVWLLATGKLDPRMGEIKPDEAALRRGIDGVDVSIIGASRDVFASMVATIDRIEAVWTNCGGAAGGVRLEKLKQLASGIAETLDGFVAAKNPALSSKPAPASEASSSLAGGRTPQSIVAATIANRAEAARALRGACGYFERFEPSSPAVLLLRSAERLMGKPFFEVMRVMLPDYAGKAAIKLGQNAFKLAVERLAEADEQPSKAPRETSAVTAEPLEVKARSEALGLVDGVAAFLRIAEPASPLPLLLTRAKELSERDFASLVKDMFTEPTIRSMRDED